ncbi:unnamed protein product [Acanthoscelides obtectus]|uniref:BTB domain-containing protein n=1 Tax=Acanthoscelides obtectus TaxID=200917 RepID=A0A9P0NR24_ACAOB|nr:unnamed protein product [Acanthoscelides obtectus]CAK1628873.1 Transcription factor Ken 2 [Acanthoscelides obtectus]
MNWRYSQDWFSLCPLLGPWKIEEDNSTATNGAFYIGSFSSLQPKSAMYSEDQESHGLLTLHYGKHHATIVDEIKTCFASENFADMTFICDDKTTLSAHKLVMASASPLVRRILGETVHAHGPSVVLIPGIKSCHLKHLLDFLYNGQACIKSDMWQSSTTEEAKSQSEDESSWTATENGNGEQVSVKKENDDDEKEDGEIKDDEDDDDEDTADGNNEEQNSGSPNPKSEQKESDVLKIGQTTVKIATKVHELSQYQQRMKRKNTYIEPMDLKQQEDFSQLKPPIGDQKLISLVQSPDNYVTPECRPGLERRDISKLRTHMGRLVSLSNPSECSNRQRRPSGAHVNVFIKCQ